MPQGTRWVRGKVMVAEPCRNSRASKGLMGLQEEWNMTPKGGGSEGHQGVMPKPCVTLVLKAPQAEAKLSRDHECARAMWQPEGLGPHQPGTHMCSVALNGAKKFCCPFKAEKRGKKVIGREGRSDGSHHGGKKTTWKGKIPSGSAASIPSLLPCLPSG